ncbi:MAG: TrmH family RNA methyltransferase [Chloroflexota bacterium]
MSQLVERITSLQNARVKYVRKLREKRQRLRDRRFVIDDGRDFLRALEQGYQVDYAFYCETLDDAAQTGLKLLTAYNILHTVFQVTLEVMQKASYRDNPGPLVAVVHAPVAPLLDEIDTGEMDRVLILVNLLKPGNIGALMRTADAAGFRTIMLVDCDLDLYNPNLIRSSTGACFLKNVYQTTTDEVLAFLAGNDIDIMAAVVDGNATLFDVPLTPPIAFVMGTEDVGLDARWLDAAHHRVRIPMSGQISDSLNVSVSGAIFMYEVYRQSLVGTGRL